MDRIRSAGKLLPVIMAGILMWGSAALAGGGNVLPACAELKGYSLSEMAKATAVYNTGIVAGLSETAPKVAMEVLVGDATVKAGTAFYLPIFFVDDSGAATPGFPRNVRDEKADQEFLMDYVNEAFGVESFIVQVDGKTTVLSDQYISGVKTGPLPDGIPAGTHYIVSAAFLTPLTPGVHTVGVGGLIGGQPVVFLSYQVNVK
ncbi:MAG TPA: hypothetical protein VM008_09785 [Phycisphaerae bacterium]|nr:hypothetical protein [Phycisphaerae bacterium]